MITASGVPVVLPETKATNGVLFKVDGLLEPPCGTIARCLKECPVFKKLTEAMEKVNLEEMLNGTCTKYFILRFPGKVFFSVLI